MTKQETFAFETRLLRPATPDGDEAWAFVILPRAVSETLPRRGRTTVDGSVNGCPFQTTLDPDGQLSHWLKVTRDLLDAACVRVGDTVTVSITPVAPEPEPKVPEDLQRALSASPEAHAVWASTTTIARLDWIHWIESAKQASTRKHRVDAACDRLASGKRRVCCFDSSGYYSKSLRAPEAAGVA